MGEPVNSTPTRRREAIDVARVLALALVVTGHLLLAVIDRVGDEIRGANLLALHPGWAILAAAAPMPVFFAAGGYANAKATLGSSVTRLRPLAGLGTVVVVAWSSAVVVAVLTTGHSGIVGDGARLATQPLWFVAAYAPFATSGRWLAWLAARHPVASIGGCLAALAILDLSRLALDGPRWVGWIGFAPAWVVPWLAGGWWRDRVERGVFDERRVGALLAAAFIAAAIVLVHLLRYSPALIDAVPAARSNTTPPTLYTACVGLAQVGVLMLAARSLDAVGRRWRRAWTRAGEAAVGVYVWHLTALTLCAAAIAAGLPTPTRLTTLWWITRPLWWALVLAIALAFVVGTDHLRRRIGRSTERRASGSRWRAVVAVTALTVAAGAVGLKGPRTLPLATVLSALFLLSWSLLRASPGLSRTEQSQ